MRLFRERLLNRLRESSVNSTTTKPVRQKCVLQPKFPAATEKQPDHRHKLKDPGKEKSIRADIIDIVLQWKSKKAGMKILGRISLLDLPLQ